MAEVRCRAVSCCVVYPWRRVAPVSRPDRLRLCRRPQPLSRTRLKPSCCSGYEPFCRPTSRAHSGQRAIPCSATSCFKDIPSTLYRDSWRAVARYGSHRRPAGLTTRAAHVDARASEFLPHSVECTVHVWPWYATVNARSHPHTHGKHRMRSASPPCPTSRSSDSDPET